MVDFNLEIDKLCPFNVKEIELSKYKIDENIKKSIILYNVALGEMKKGNFDQVISDLEKALYYNKEFTEAIKLMGLCYVCMSEYKKAEKLFKSLNKYEVYNDLIKEYLQSLSSKKSIYKTSTVTETVEDMYNIRGDKGNGSSKKKIIGLVIITVIAAGVGINYLHPEIMQGMLTKFKAVSQSEHNNSETKKNDTVLSKEQTNTNSINDKVVVEKKADDNVKSEISPKNIDNANLQDDAYKNETLNMLNDAEKALNSENYEKAAGILVDVKSRNLDDDTKSKFSQLRQNLSSNPMWKIYNDGNSLYKQNKYTEALPKLLISYEFVPDKKLLPWITYEIGMCYKGMNDYANAHAYLNKVKEDYPKSEYVYYAKVNISEIGN
ncbi:tetratricopeptide repeat protein [Clostridium saccharoperbutylacetonicum]|uniref:tetratricopeptide repeat protein n=1 Tax=Clostridium saccharoperbutylacetonicum TaxID=36745 RepID=UPI0039E991BD